MKTSVFLIFLKNQGVSRGHKHTNQPIKQNSSKTPPYRLNIVIYVFFIPKSCFPFVFLIPVNVFSSLSFFFWSFSLPRYTLGFCGGTGGGPVQITNVLNYCNLCIYQKFSFFILFTYTDHATTNFQQRSSNSPQFQIPLVIHLIAFSTQQYSTLCVLPLTLIITA